MLATCEVKVKFYTWQLYDSVFLGGCLLLLIQTFEVSLPSVDTRETVCFFDCDSVTCIILVRGSANVLLLQVNVVYMYVIKSSLQSVALFAAKNDNEMETTRGGLEPHTVYIMTRGGVKIWGGECGGGTGTVHARQRNRGIPAPHMDRLLNTALGASN